MKLFVYDLLTFTKEFLKEKLLFCAVKKQSYVISFLLKIKVLQEPNVKASF